MKLLTFKDILDFEDADFEDSLSDLQNFAGPEGLKAARLFAADCAEHVLHIFEARHPGDNRAAEAIRLSRAYANGEATHKEMFAAQNAAKQAPRAHETAMADAWSAWNAWPNRSAWAARSTWAEDQEAEFEWQKARLKEYLRGEAA